MEELLKELKEKVGLSEEQAKKTFSTLVSFMKSKLPAGLSDNVEGLLSGKMDLSSMMSGLFGGSDKEGEAESGPLDALKNMFGGNEK